MTCTCGAQGLPHLPHCQDYNELSGVIRLEYPLSCTVEKDKLQVFKIIVQSMLNRLIVGEIRYGPPRKRQKYMTRLLKEAEAYKQTGNAEQLINIANYCILEWIAPEHPKHHFDATVESVTRASEKSKM
jgi:hypothetical protein